MLNVKKVPSLLNLLDRAERLLQPLLALLRDKENGRNAERNLATENLNKLTNSPEMEAFRLQAGRFFQNCLELQKNAHLPLLVSLSRLRLWCQI